MAKYYVIPITKIIESEVLIKVPDDLEIDKIPQSELIREANLQHAFDGPSNKHRNIYYEVETYDAYEDPERIIREIGTEDAPYDFQ